MGRSMGRYPDRHDKSIHFFNLQNIFDCLHDRQIAELLSVTRRLKLVNSIPHRNIPSKYQLAPFVQSSYANPE